MFFKKATSPKAPKSASSEQDRRRSPRIQTAILSCELGQVLDISRKGIRITATQSPPRFQIGTQIGLLLSSPTDALDLAARVVRIRNVAGRYEIALDFAPMTDAQADAIDALARTGSTRSALNGDAARRERLIAAMRVPDHYAVLGVSPSASAEDIQKAFRALARKFHPDINKDPAAQHRFVEINEAHTILGNTDQRAEYDRAYALRRAA